ncbi:methyltransferase [Thorsellia anophelis]|uniref:Ribosomal RNA small subunit methyltransferase C n=1 Tax=Thorsellia anophelis DSM 18579 TaxID=1123402 RepID=A0A1I0C8P4_9GAMM|nr:methyltransferase [Thorsellia anophelis]SET15849.1 16S rRNA m(2)G 1207 methyltransferase [Thorsellia anophelis DSM 18579]
MHTHTPASLILNRHTELLNQHTIIFAGDIQDNFAAEFKQSKVLTSQFHHAKRLEKNGIDTVYKAIFDKLDVEHATLLVYYWPKVKEEALFQLTQLLSIVNEQTEILIVGENRVGVRSIENRFNDILTVQKIDTAKRCSLYYAKLNTVPKFDIENYWKSYSLPNGKMHYALPGVFSRDHLDSGSRLLISSFIPEDKHTPKNPKHTLAFLTTPQLKADVLDLCCGAGVIALALHEHFPNLTWTLADSQAQSIESAKRNMNEINLQAKIIASDILSEIEGKFDMIISNPPFHDGKQTDYAITERLISAAPKYLRDFGALRIVANGFLPYETFMQSAFGNVEIIAKNTQFTVYQSVKLR